MGWLRKNKKNKKQILERGAMLLEDIIECCDGKSNPIKFFSANEILKATDNFSNSNYVSNFDDYYLTCYSGMNENHENIHVKKFKRSRFGNFCRDTAISSIVSGHKNFMKLVGCCLEYEEPLVVYQGVKKHYTLDMSEQPWQRRMKIAEDIATALAYLHTAFPRPFVHRTLSPSNILLDDDGVAKLSGFSNCVSIPQGETFVEVDMVVGTVRYLDKNYQESRLVSEKTDIFAFGAVMQTLLVGYYNFLKAYELEEKEECEGDDDDNSNDFAAMSEINDRRQFSDYDNVPYNLSEFKRFKFMIKGRMDEIADQEMLEKMGDISEQELSQMKAFGMLSLRCMGFNGEVPTMVEVAKELKKIQRSPLLLQV